MDNFIKDIAENTYRYYNKRKVVIWGSYNTADDIEKELKENYNIETAFKVDGDEFKVDGKTVREISSLKGKSEEYYIIVPVGFYKSVGDTLKEYGYVKNKDYYYYHDCAVIETDEYFEDLHGNKIYGDRKNVNVVFTGHNATLKFGEGFKIKGTLNIKLGDSCVAYIGKNAKISAGGG